MAVEASWDDLPPVEQAVLIALWENDGKGSVAEAVSGTRNTLFSSFGLKAIQDAPWHLRKRGLMGWRDAEQLNESVSKAAHPYGLTWEGALLVARALTERRPRSAREGEDGASQEAGG